MSAPLDVQNTSQPFTLGAVGLDMANRGSNIDIGSYMPTTQGVQNNTYNSAASAVGLPSQTNMQSPGSVTNGTGLNTAVNQSETLAKYMVDKDKAYSATLMGKAEPYLKGANSIASTFGSLANIYLGFQQMGIMKDQLSMAKEQWAEQKQELAHVRGVRKRLSASYMA